MDDKKRVLIIDDDPNILEIYGTKLKNEGYEVLTASDGDKGLEAARNNMPDAILLDIMMPGKTGIEVLKILQSQNETYKIPVVVLSNVSQEETIEKVSAFSTKFYAIKALNTPDKIAGLVKEAIYAEQ